MERLKLMIGDKQVVKRFIGNKLVWEGVILLVYTASVFLRKQGNQIILTYYSDIDIEIKATDIRKIILKDISGKFEITDFPSISLVRDAGQQKTTITFMVTSSDYFRIPDQNLEGLEIWGRG